MSEYGQNTDNFRVRRICITFKNCQIYVFGNDFGGADRDRTDDLLNAIQALSQLSYGPTNANKAEGMRKAGDEAPSYLTTNILKQAKKVKSAIHKTIHSRAFSDASLSGGL